MLCADEVLAALKLMVNDLRLYFSGKHSSYILVHSHLNLIYFLHKDNIHAALK